ncbi:MAG: DUF4375 domain-containing protein [Ruminococcaceae bacterium]|nr:DUF4375 domain-containing protein [Oscillospiraceae bacterium]
MRKLIILLVLMISLMSGCMVSSNDGITNDTAPNTDEILAMEDNDMYDALITRFMDAEPNTLNQKQLTVAALITFDAEMMNGGLCQFFVNDYNGYAQYIRDALGEVGAVEMQKHYSTFVNQNEIDVTKMNSFRIVSIQDYLKQYERFPYESFDTTFSEIYQNEDLSELLLAYVRLHGDEILN